MFEEVLAACKEWFYANQKLYADRLKMFATKDDSKVFFANIETDVYLTSICVSEPDYRPYRFVEFCVLDSRRELDQTPSFWYGDEDGESIQSIIDNLNKGIEFLLCK